LPSKLQQYYERVVIPYPKATAKIQELYDIIPTQLIFLLIINNANRNSIKITRKDIHYITGYNRAYISNMLDEMRREGVIITQYNYKLTDYGKRIVARFSYLLSLYSNDIENGSILSFAEYANKNTRINSYKYKKKKGIIKEPEKSKYNKLL
jgi:DNA-binding MarR family transcriptional regulator